VRDAAASNYTVSAIITGIVKSDSFRLQGPETHSKKEAPPTKTASTVGTSPDATTQLQGK
jgi:hypothetical protein